MEYVLFPHLVSWLVSDSKLNVTSVAAEAVDSAATVAAAWVTAVASVKCSASLLRLFILKILWCTDLQENESRGGGAIFWFGGTE